MKALLAKLLGRTPVGWLQLTHNRARLAAAAAGVAFANVLVFVQLGFLGALNNTITGSYDLFDADIMISAEDAHTLTEGGNVARAHLFAALADPGIASGAGLFIGTAEWARADAETSFRVLAFAPERMDFFTDRLRPATSLLTLPDAAVVDRGARGVAPETLEAIGAGRALAVEMQDRRLSLVGTFEGGVTFASDGYMIVSDQTFLRMFPARSSGAPDHVLLRLAPGHRIDDVLPRLQAALPETLRVRSREDAALEDQIYQTTERPTGLIFGFGVAMGVIVGVVIVYQVLASDVADHLAEYATFKAIGYGQPYFFGVVFEEAVVLALIGFVPGLLVSLVAYEFLIVMTGLPLELTIDVAVAVLLGTVAACSISGAIATRRLAGADPADLF